MQPPLRPPADQPALDPDAVAAALRPFELEAAGPHDIADGRDWAAAMIGPGIAAPEVMARVQRRMGGAALFVRREPGGLCGMLGWIALSGAGLDAVLTGRFCGPEPDDAHIAAPGQPVAGCYGWGLAASHKAASRAVLGATAVLNDALFADAAFFSRAATRDGRRVIVERFHYQPAPGGDPDLFWRPPARSAE